MATLTLPMGAPVLGQWVPGYPDRWWSGTDGRMDGSGRSGGARPRVGRIRGWLSGRAGRIGREPLSSRRAASLVVDQLGEPADLSVHRFQAVALQLQRVAVEALAGAGQRGPEALPLPLHCAPATFQDPQPGVGGGV